MDAAHLLAFNLTLLAAMASPGPALLLALRTSLAYGPAAGIATGAGLGLMAATWTAAALLGLGLVFALFPFAYVAIKTAGALYLLWIAYTMWRDARQPLTEAAGPLDRARAFRTGLLVNLGNPKSVLFASAVLLVIFPPDLSLTAKALIVLNHLVVEVIVYSCFALLLSTPPARSGYLRAKPMLDRIAAGVLGLLGLRLLLDHPE
nr:LysE family transporter [Puniceibacterium sp. IMCC21224]